MKQQNKRKMNRLCEIIDNKRRELAVCKERLPLTELQLRRSVIKPPLSAALRAVPMGLIAEVKRRSPSVGLIRPDLRVGELAMDYERANVQAISVLLDEKYFGGGEQDFCEVRAMVALPLLYKEFVIDEWQIWHASALGASAVLLIVSALSELALTDLLCICTQAGVEALVEVHDKHEMRIAAASGATFIGINNRDLRTFTTKIATSLQLCSLAPPGCTLISESGIRTAEDVVCLRAAGFHGVLVGEHLLRQKDVVHAVHELLSDV